VAGVRRESRQPVKAAALAETGHAPTGRCGVGLHEDLAASQLPPALADLARLHPGATSEVLSPSNAAMREAYDALMPANVEPVMAWHTTDALPILPDVEFGLIRHPRTEGDPLIDAVQTALRRMI
jgi:DNA-binding transcriptional LysR family regulator